MSTEVALEEQSVEAASGEADAHHRSGANEPLRLLAEDPVDLSIMSAALQDSILRPVDIVWEKAARRLTIQLSRFCWECGGTWVRAGMQFGDVISVKSRRLPRGRDTHLELLAIHFQDGEAPGGQAILMFAGGGDLRVDVECLDVVVADLSDRWQARVAPTHLDGAHLNGAPSTEEPA